MREIYGGKPISGVGPSYARPHVRGRKKIKLRALNGRGEMVLQPRTGRSN